LFYAPAAATESGFTLIGGIVESNQFLDLDAIKTVE
jgi:hypothetical protein